MKLKQDQIHMTHSEDWPMYLSLEQREQLLSEKIARAVAAVKAESKSLAKNVNSTQTTHVGRNTRIKI